MPKPKNTSIYCKVQGCGILAYYSVKELCKKHYLQVRRTGTTIPLEKERRSRGCTLGEALLAGVDLGKPDDCWEWKKSKAKGGYGWIGWEGQTKRAHILSWVDAHGPVPEGLRVRHKCDNPPCINPNHLLLGTDLQNEQDKWERGRGLFGEAHPGARFSEAQVLAFRRGRADFRGSTSEYARSLGVNPPTMYQILSGKTWKHLPINGVIDGIADEAAK